MEEHDAVRALWAARQLLQVNLALSLAWPGFEGYIESHLDRLRAWL
jgi:hypothetical protein